MHERTCMQALTQAGIRKHTQTYTKAEDWTARHTNVRSLDGAAAIGMVKDVFGALCVRTDSCRYGQPSMYTYIRWYQLLLPSKHVNMQTQTHTGSKTYSGYYVASVCSLASTTLLLHLIIIYHSAQHNPVVLSVRMSASHPPPHTIQPWLSVL